jgi:CDP-paratose 2-epimerase
LSTILITGASGLIGAEAVLFYGRDEHRVVGVDNDMRRYFFGQDASTRWNRERIQEILGNKYEHHNVDIRNAGTSTRYSRSMLQISC